MHRNINIAIYTPFSLHVFYATFLLDDKIAKTHIPTHYCAYMHAHIHYLYFPKLEEKKYVKSARIKVYK